MAGIVEEAAKPEHRLEETRLKLWTDRVLAALGNEDEFFASLIGDDAHEPDAAPGVVLADGAFLADDLGAVSAPDERSKGILDDDIGGSLEHHDYALSSSVRWAERDAPGQDAAPLQNTYDAGKGWPERFEPPMVPT